MYQNVMFCLEPVCLYVCMSVYLYVCLSVSVFLKHCSVTQTQLFLPKKVLKQFQYRNHEKLGKFQYRAGKNFLYKKRVVQRGVSDERAFKIEELYSNF